MKKTISLFTPAFLLLVVFYVPSRTGSKEKSKRGAVSFSVTNDNKEELVFQSGFEGSCQVVSFGEINNKIIGKDNTLAEKNDWVNDLDSADRYNNIYFNYTGGDSTKRFAKIIPEPGHPNNKVLWYWLNDSWLASENQQKARVQLDFYGIKKGYKEFYQSVRVFLHDDFNTLKTYPHPINWLTLSEFWNNEWWVKTEKYGFRITLGIGKAAAESDLYFILNAENAGQKEVWNARNENRNKVKVPIGKWFTMEYYYKEGDKENGRFYMAITPEGESKQVVFDVKNYTQNTTDPAPDGVTGYNPMKLYTSKEVVGFMRSQGKTLQVYWDDFKLWKNKRPG